MDNFTFVIVWSLLGCVSFVIGVMLAYRNAIESQSLLLARIEQATNDLRTDLERIGIPELQQTEAGRELLRLRALKTQEAQNPLHASHKIVFDLSGTSLLLSEHASKVLRVGIIAIVLFFVIYTWPSLLLVLLSTIAIIGIMVVTLLQLLAHK